jgi:hypothetical protein
LNVLCDWSHWRNSLMIGSAIFVLGVIRGSGGPAGAALAAAPSACCYCAVKLVAEQIIGGLDVAMLAAVRHQCAEVDSHDQAGARVRGRQIPGRGFACSVGTHRLMRLNDAIRECASISNESSRDQREA